MISHISLGLRLDDLESQSQVRQLGWDPLTPDAEKLGTTVSELFRFPASDIRTHVTATGLLSVVDRALHALGSPNRRVVRKGRKLALKSKVKSQIKKIYIRDLKNRPPGDFEKVFQGLEKGKQWQVFADPEDIVD